MRNIYEKIFAVGMILITTSCNSFNSQDRFDSKKSSDTSINSNTKDNIIHTSDIIHLKDSINQYLENISNISFLDLSFCIPEIISKIKTDKTFSQRWVARMNASRRMYTDSLSYIPLDKEMAFFKSRIIDYSKEKSTDVSFIIGSLPIYKDTIFTILKYKKILSMYRNTDGAGFGELSNIYYSLLIIDGENFVSSTTLDTTSEKVFRSWMENIEQYEYVAFTDTFTPPQIIERKRKYLLLNLKGQNKLTEDIKYKIEIAKLRVIN